jgi:hypothetical protein
MEDAMTDTQIDDESTVCTVIRIERVYTSDFDDGYSQIDVDCLTQDLWAEVFDLCLPQKANDPDK